MTWKQWSHGSGILKCLLNHTWKWWLGILVLFVQNRIQRVVAGTERISRPGRVQEAGFAMPGSQEGLSLKGPLRSQVPMWLSKAWAELPAVLLWGPRPSLPTIRLSSPKCPAVGGQSHVALPHPVLCYPRAWPWHLKTLAQGSTAEQTCAVERPASPLRVRPTRRARPHPLCLDSLGDALGHLFCPFLSEGSSHHCLRPFCVGIVFSVCS